MDIFLQNDLTLPPNAMHFLCYDTYGKEGKVLRMPLSSSELYKH